MLSTAQYIETNLHIPYNKFIEVLQKMPLELKNEFQTDLEKPIQKTTKRKKASAHKSTEPEYVAYTLKGKGLTKQEYINEVLKTCEETDNRKNCISHEEFFAKYFDL